jgi:hypothetical protein
MVSEKRVATSAIQSRLSAVAGNIKLFWQPGLARIADLQTGFLIRTADVAGYA